MSIRKLVSALVLAAVPLAPIAARATVAAPNAAASRPAAPCELRQYKISSVTPYRIQKSAGGHIIVDRLAGAELFVQAEPGLTAEWLWASLARDAAAMRGSVAMGDCVFGVDKLQVEVASAGPGFRIRLIAPDAQAGQEVLRRAQLLVS